MSFEKDAGVILGAIGGRRTLDEGETIALRSQGGEALDEIVLRHPDVRGDRRGFIEVDFHEAGPAAAVCAALAGVMDFAGQGVPFVDSFGGRSQKFGPA